jgi:BirA family biotin operon repressor/biotin-[acetyl-CoA-carboxylase] ligase
MKMSHSSFPFGAVFELGDVDSTNSYLAELLDSGADPRVVYSFRQRSGRGRNGREWLTTLGETLAISFTIDRQEFLEPLTWCPLLVGAVLTRIVRETGANHAKLKWPNDVMVNDKKLAGILVEVQPDGRLVVGVGLNVYSEDTDLPHSDATSLLLQGVRISDVREELIHPLLDEVLNILRIYQDLSHTERARSWRDYVSTEMDTIGRTVMVDLGGGNKVSGEAIGLEMGGGLRVKDLTSGSETVIHSGDVFHIERS